MAEAEADAEMAALAHDYCKGTAQTAEQVLSDWMARFAGPDGRAPRLYRAAGCAKCNHTGHKGRVGIYELMTASPVIKKLVQARAPVDQLFKAAVGDGMLTLKQYGLLKVMEGLTDVVSVQSACA
jgi:type II secretory ATPase GspE/PulE/Tfp pilus assembly ATPase PilB-like protein